MDSTSWVQLGLDIIAAFDQFGNSVSMNVSGDRVSIDRIIIHLW